MNLCEDVFVVQFSVRPGVYRCNVMSVTVKMGSV